MGAAETEAFVFGAVRGKLDRCEDPAVKWTGAGQLGIEEFKFEGFLGLDLTVFGVTIAIGRAVTVTDAISGYFTANDQPELDVFLFSPGTKTVRRAIEIVLGSIKIPLLPSETIQFPRIDAPPFKKSIPIEVGCRQ